MLVMLIRRLTSTESGLLKGVQDGPSDVLRFVKFGNFHKETSISLEEILEAREAFVTGTAAAVRARSPHEIRSDQVVKSVRIVSFILSFLDFLGPRSHQWLTCPQSWTQSDGVTGGVDSWDELFDSVL